MMSFFPVRIGVVASETIDEVLVHDRAMASDVVNDEFFPARIGSNES